MTQRVTYKVIPAVYLLLFNGTRVMLSKRANTGYEDRNYGLIAGHVEESETLRAALAREAFEEAGLEIESDAINLALVMHRWSATSEPSERMDFFLRVDNFQGELVNREPGKCDELSWFEIANLPSNTIAYIRHAIEKVAVGASYCEYGWSSSSSNS